MGCGPTPGQISDRTTGSRCSVTVLKPVKLRTPAPAVWTDRSPACIRHTGASRIASRIGTPLVEADGLEGTELTLLDVNIAATVDRSRLLIDR